MRRASTFAILAALAALACGGPSARVGPAVMPVRRHFQVIPAMTTPERRRLVDLLREREPGAGWTVNEEALGASVAVVDPFARFLRRARRARPSVDVTEPVPVEDAARVARAFVRRNADLLGVPRRVALGLGEQASAIEAADRARTTGAPRASRFRVRFDAAFPTKGYEAFRELDNTIDVEVFLDGAGEVIAFVNLSKVHPHLALDTRPDLGPGDPRVVEKLLGRTLFALAGEPPGPDPLAPDDARELRRLPLGPIQPEDVERVAPVILASVGPRFAWVAYRLAYAVDVAKPAAPGRFFFFRYVVDADTGDVLEDARAPIVAE